MVDCPIRHMGTEKAQQIYGAIQHFLIEKGWKSALALTAPTCCWKTAAVWAWWCSKPDGSAEEIRARDIVVASRQRGGLAGKALPGASHRPISRAR